VLARDPTSTSLADNLVAEVHPRRLRGKRALVTGGAKGIGRAIAHRLVQEGAEVLCVDLEEASHHDQAGLTMIQADVTDPGAMAQATQLARARGSLDICVANAGVFLEFEPFVQARPEAWESILRVNVVGVLVTFQAAARAMVQDGQGGCLLATSSITGLRGEAGWPAYCASKAAVIAIVQSLAVELASRRIRVNAVAPGEVDTPYHVEIKERLLAPGSDARGAAGLTTATRPIPRMATADEVAAAFAFLASEDARYITGTTLTVDGGALLS
jgi:NAD(P)-dependent dehydrogenase (short-subunit alcohol dehydrogenase family)